MLGCLGGNGRREGRGGGMIELPIAWRSQSGIGDGATPSSSATTADQPSQHSPKSRRRAGLSSPRCGGTVAA